MQTKFFIKSNAPCLSIKQILKAAKGISQYSAEDTLNLPADCTEEGVLLGKEDTLYLPVDCLDEEIVLGKERKSVRGFELFYSREKESYTVTLNNPCSVKDWKIALSFIKKLGNFLHEDTVTDQNGTKYPIKSIHRYPFRKDILLGIREALQSLKSGSDGFLEIPCINRTAAFDAEMLETILADKNPVKKFSNALAALQYENACIAPQYCYETDKLKGIYTLCTDMRCIIPLKPVMDSFFRTIYKNKTPEHWTALLLAPSDNPEKEYETVGEAEYGDFLQKLPKEKYVRIDANYIMTEPFSKEEIQNILSPTENSPKKTV